MIAGKQNPYSENLRLSALSDLHVSDTGPERAFDRITDLARTTLRFPLAYISLITSDRQVLKTTVEVPICDGSRETAFCSRTIYSSQPYVVEDTLDDPVLSTYPQVRCAPFIRSYWGAPLTTRSGFHVGAFCVLDVVPRRPVMADLTTLHDFARLTVEFMELRAQATTDVLTGVHTRRAFLARGEDLFASALASRKPFSCIVLDLDHFKELNDTLGHTAGDDTLRQVGTLLNVVSQGNCLVGRIGGEEFGIIIPGARIDDAHRTAEKARSALSELAGNGVPRVTGSFGVASRETGDSCLRDILERADGAAYQAKAAGRNCVREALPVRLSHLRAPRHIADGELKMLQK